MIVQLQRDADRFRAGTAGKAGHDRRIDAARHGHNDATRPCGPIELKKVEHLVFLAEVASNGQKRRIRRLVYDPFTLRAQNQTMFSNLPAREGIAPGRPDLPSLLASAAARQFRTPTANVQARLITESPVHKSPDTAVENGRGSFNPEVADAILAAPKPL
jgi:hypothetical protein